MNHRSSQPYNPLFLLESKSKVISFYFGRFALLSSFCVPWSRQYTCTGKYLAPVLLSPLFSVGEFKTNYNVFINLSSNITSSVPEFKMRQNRSPVKSCSSKCSCSPLISGKIVGNIRRQKSVWLNKTIHKWRREKTTRGENNLVYSTLLNVLIYDHLV